MIPKIHHVPQDRCPICHCAQGLVSITLADCARGVDPFLQARSAVITGIIQGLRRDELDLCDQCRTILERSVQTIEQLLGPPGSARPAIIG